ncbi:MAG TPA: glycosyltransferase family 2 protein [Chthoniobacterales bacterium]|nr:glycosyltransferase family 2 protein [Chthoniobacterales bacterium]
MSALTNNSTIAAVIPAYQEQKHVGEVAQRARTQLEHVLVVDDGSTDATADSARAAGVDVVVHPQNRGKGESIKTGLRYWFDRGSEYVVVLDADGQHLPEEISRFVDATEAESDAKIFVGSRMDDTRSMPVLRRMVNRYMSNKISRICGQQIPDTQCGFRMLHRDIIPEVLSGASRFEYETEMLIIASRKGYRIASIPITTIYCDEVSSINPVRDTLRFFKLMRRYKRL